MYVLWLVHIVPWLMHTCAMHHTCMRHDPCTCVPWLMHTRHISAMTPSNAPWLMYMYVKLAGGATSVWTGLGSMTCAYMCHDSLCHDSCIYVPWLMHIKYPMTNVHSCKTRGRSDSCLHRMGGYGSYIHVQWLIRIKYTMTHVCLWKNSVRSDSSIHRMGAGYLIYVPWLVHIHAMTHAYMCHDSFIYVLWLVHTCAMTHTCEAREIRHSFKCAMTHSVYVKLAGEATAVFTGWGPGISFPLKCLRVVEAVEVCFSHVWHDSFICVSSLIHVRDMTHSYMWRDWCICETWLY